MKIQITQCNPIVGDLRGNFNIIKQNIQLALQDNCDVVVFPELVTVGYPPRDLLYDVNLWEAHDRAILDLYNFIKNFYQQITVIFGGLHQVQKTHGIYERYNAGYIIDKIEGIRIVHKRLLPCYDVFDENRYFKSGMDEPYIPIDIHLQDKSTVLCDVIICEDMWNFQYSGRKLTWITPASYIHDPIANLKGTGPLFILNASPYWHNKIETTRKLVNSIHSVLNRSVIWVNQIGAHDDIVFGGYSMCFVDNYGFSAKAFAEDRMIIRHKSKVLRLENICDHAPITWKPEYNNHLVHPDDNETYYTLMALSMSLKEYCRKTGFTKAVFGCSGGIDSAVVGAIASQALGGENVTAITMPSKYSSEGSWSDSEELARNCRMNFVRYPISKIHDEFLAVTLSGSKQIFNNPVTDENLQPRIRAVLLMAYSNENNALLISTGNKSEIAVGYSTIYGDAAGGFSLLGDVYKTEVYNLANFINKYHNMTIIPENCIKKAPSAELKPNQKDSDSLPPYDVLDQILYDIIESNLSLYDVAKKHPDKHEQIHKIWRMIDKSEFKRSQSPICPKISHRSFGSGRRIPIAKRCTYD